MNCLYCNKPCPKDHYKDTPGAPAAFFDCIHCNVSFFMLKSGKPDIISFKFSHHQIDLDYEYPTATRLFKVNNPDADNPEYILLLKLPHIIPIDPAQKDYWLHKLLNLIIYS